MSETYFLDKIGNAKIKVKIEKLRFDIFTYCEKNIRGMSEEEMTGLAKGKGYCQFLSPNKNYQLQPSEGFVSEYDCKFINAKLNAIDVLQSKIKLYPK